MKTPDTEFSKRERKKERKKEREKERRKKRKRNYSIRIMVVDKYLTLIGPKDFMDICILLSVCGTVVMASSSTITERQERGKLHLI